MVAIGGTITRLDGAVIGGQEVEILAGLQGILNRFGVLPKQLSQGNLDRVLRESQNDFLEKVFDVKDNYSDYKLDDSEVEYLACLESKGFVSQVNR